MGNKTARIEVPIKVETEKLDEAIKKAKELKELLEEVHKLIDSLK